MTRISFLFLFILFSSSGVDGQSLRIAHQKEFAPYAWLDSTGAPQGVFIDWWRVFAERTGTNMEFIPGSTEECVELVLDGKADVVAGLFFEQEYAEELIYPGSIMRMNTVLALKRPKRPRSVYEIDFQVGILSKEISYSFVKEKYPELKLKKYKDFEELLNDVEEKRVEGFIYEFPNPIIRNVEVDMPDGYYQYLVLRGDKIRPAVKKGNTRVLELLAQGNAMITDQDLALIAEKYSFFKEDPFLRWWEWLGIGTTFALLLSTLILYRRLKRNRIQRPDLSEEHIKDLIKGGENDRVELKSSLKWDYRQEQSNKSLEMVIVKTVAAFLNSQGGNLLIGVGDEGNILGLEPDYKSTGNKGKDGIILAVTNLLNKHLGKKVHGFVRMDVIEMEGGDVGVIHVEPSDQPVFLGKNENEEFFIRASASSQPLAMSETLEYINSRFNN